MGGRWGRKMERRNEGASVLGRGSFMPLRANDFGLAIPLWLLIYLVSRIVNPKGA